MTSEASSVFKRTKGTPSVCPFILLEDAENDQEGHPLEGERRREERQTRIASLMGRAKKRIEEI